MRKILIGAGVILALGFGVWFLLASRSVPLVSSKALRPTPEFLLKDYKDGDVGLADFRGKPVLVNLWASWCPFCKQELKDFAALKRDFGDDAVIIAINRAEAAEIARRYSMDLGVTDDLVLLLDPEDSFYQSINGFSMPETIFIDREGFVRYHKRGAMEKEEIRRRIEDLISQAAAL